METNSLILGLEYARGVLEAFASVIVKKGDELGLNTYLKARDRICDAMEWIAEHSGDERKEESET